MGAPARCWSGHGHLLDYFLRSLFTILALVCWSPFSPAQSAPLLERGTAVTDPAALRELDRGPFGLARMLGASPGAPLTDSALFALPSMAPIRISLDQEFERYIGRHKAELPGESIGRRLAIRIFNCSTATNFIPARRALCCRASSTGWTVPMWRRRSCGEIRLIYRLTEIDAPPVGDHSRFGTAADDAQSGPESKADHATEGSPAALTCAAIARRWLDSANWPLDGAALADKLTSEAGPLASIGPDNIDALRPTSRSRIVAPSPDHEFRTDYLLKVFDYNPQTKLFEEATLEDQVDRDRLASDEKLWRDFKAWLLDPIHLREFDRGTVLIPKQFLARRAIAPTPIGFSPSRLQPAFGMVEGEGDSAVFSTDDVVTALQKAAAHGISLQNIRSVAGFERRLNDISCAGCHQTRGNRRLSFSRRGLDGGPSQQRHDRAGLAAFLRRSGSPPRYSLRNPRRQSGRLFARFFRTAAAARQPRTGRQPNMTMAGARIAMPCRPKADGQACR